MAANLYLVGDKSFKPVQTALSNNFTVKDGGWVTQDKYPRQVADVNGDGLADLIGFGADNVYVSLATNNVNKNDSLLGGAGNDTLDGLTGNNTLNGFNGNDSLIGCSGSDRFLFNTNTAFNLGAIGKDNIDDFVKGQDKIVLDRTTFNALGGSISFASVNTLAQALTNAARITYIKSTGNLYYNQNGTAAGFGTGGLFANLYNLPALAASDFSVVA